MRSNQSKKRESSYPWFDPELVRLANKKDKMHAYWLKNTTNEEITSKFTQLKELYFKKFEGKTIELLRQQEHQ